MLRFPVNSFLLFRCFSYSIIDRLSIAWRHSNYRCELSTHVLINFGHMIGVTCLRNLPIDEQAVLAVHVDRAVFAPSHRRQCVIIATARVVILLINLSQVGQASWTHSFWWLLSGDYINRLRSSTWTRVVRRLHISRVLEDLLNSSFHSFLTWIDKTALTTFFRALW